MLRRRNLRLVAHHHSLPWVLLGLTILALGFRLVLAIGFPNDAPDDGRFYALIARNLLEHGVYSGDGSAPYVPTYVRVPGYPLFLAAVYAVCGIDHNTAVRIIQAVIDTLTCWVVAALALALAPASWSNAARRRTLVAALALAALCPFTAIYVATILTETLAIALGTALAWCSVEALARRASCDGDRPAISSRGGAWPWWLGAGAAGGALTMIRPEGGLLVAGAVVALCVSIMPQRRRVAGVRPCRIMPSLRSAGVFSLGVALFIAPWTYRNYATFGVFQPIAPQSASMPRQFVASGYTRWLGTWVDAPRFVGPFEFDLDVMRFNVDQMPDWAFDSPEERARVAGLFARYNGPTPEGASAPELLPPAGMTPDLDREFASLARERIARHPFRHYVILPATRAASLWLDTHSQYYPFEGDLFPLSALEDDHWQGFWLPLFAFVVGLYTILGVVGGLVLMRMPAARPGVWLLVLITVPRFILLASLENPEPRYTVEFFPLVAALGATASAWFVDCRARRRNDLLGAGSVSS